MKELLFFLVYLLFEKELEKEIAWTPFVMHYELLRVEHIFINDVLSLDFRAQNSPFIVPYYFLNSMSLYFEL